MRNQDPHEVRRDHISNRCSKLESLPKRPVYPFRRVRTFRIRAIVPNCLRARSKPIPDICREVPSLSPSDICPKNHAKNCGDATVPVSHCFSPLISHTRAVTFPLPALRSIPIDDRLRCLAVFEYQKSVRCPVNEDSSPVISASVGFLMERLPSILSTIGSTRTGNVDFECVD